MSYFRFLQKSYKKNLEKTYYLHSYLSHLGSIFPSFQESNLQLWTKQTKAESCFSTCAFTSPKLNKIVSFYT